MAHSKSAQKRIRQNEAARSLNRWRLRSMRTAIKDFQAAIAKGSPDEANEAYRTVSKVIDKTAQKGVIHKNQAARRKSRLAAHLKAKAAG